MKKHYKKIIITLLVFTILAGLYGLGSMSSHLLNSFQNAVAHDEVEEEDSASLSVSEDEEATSEMESAVLTYEDTTYAVGGAENETFQKLAAATEPLSENLNYQIIDYNDWLRLQSLSENSSLEGMKFWIYNENGSQQAKPWDMSQIKNQWKGIGLNKPFAGTIQIYEEASSNVTIYTPVPLFYSLSSKAIIGSSNKKLTINNTITGITGEAGGLARNFVLETPSTALGENFHNITLTGSIETTNECKVGGLFGTVTTTLPSATMNLSYNQNIILSEMTVQGSIAGGLFGEVSGEVTETAAESSQEDTSKKIILNFESVSSVAKNVTAINPKEKTDFIGNNNNAFDENVCAGGLIGRMINNVSLETKDTVDDQNNPVYKIIDNTVGGAGISGGLVGMVKKSAVYASYIEITPKQITKNVEPYIYATYVCGGFIGMADTSIVELKNLKLNADVKALNKNNKNYFSSAGGVIGRYVTTKEQETPIPYEKSHLIINNITTSNDKRCDNSDFTQKVMVYAANGTATDNTGGGILGSCNGDNVEISSINFSSDANAYNDNRYNISLIYAVGDNYGNLSNFNDVINTSNESVSGGITGSLAGKNIQIHDITFDFKPNGDNGKGSNSLGGAYVGDISGKVGYDQGNNIPTKMKVYEINVKNNYIHKAKYYHGGLFGYVGKKSIICLDGKINLDGVPFKYQIGSPDLICRDYSTSASVMLAPKGNRGFVAGYAEECLIYFDTDAIVTRSIKNEGGKISSTSGETFDPDDGIYFRNCIDDIGNAGTVFQNIKDSGNKVINFDNSYGTEVTGTLNKTEDGTKYIISSNADALRLAIAGHTYYKENQNDTTHKLLFSCFGENVTIEDLLQADYLIINDLDLSKVNVCSFLRNNSKLKFSGTMEGNNSSGKTCINLSSISKQINGGLFPTICGESKENPVIFKNLKITGQLFYHGGDYTDANHIEGVGSGSIAARAEGFCTFEQIEVTTEIKGDLYDYLVSQNQVYSNTTYRVSWDKNMLSHGGLVGEYQLNGGTLTVKNCNISPQISTIRSNCFVGGMIGKVETSSDSEGNTGEIIIMQSTIGTKITTDSNYSRYTGSVNKFHGRTAGMIAYVGNTPRTVTQINNAFDRTPAVIEDKTYVKMMIDNIKIEGTTLDLSGGKDKPINASGGLLGYAWCNADVSMKNITVDKSTTVEKSSIKSLGYVGGLVSFVAGKFDVSDITLNNFDMQPVDSSKNPSYSGLLFGDGEYAFITIDQDSYRINTDNGSVSTSGYSNFDEIVGVNVKRKHESSANIFGEKIIQEYRYGGILNIINNNFNFTSQTYDSYNNQVLDSSNKYTRYYYNLFTGNEGDWKIINSENGLNIDSPQKLMTWHVGNYANTELTHFMAPYFSEDISYRDIKTVNLTGNLDMNGYSLYPTCIDGCIINGGNAIITLYGENISDLEKNLSTTKSKVYRCNDFIKTEDNNGNKMEITQHYLMHASLLYCVENANVNNLTLKGSIANNRFDASTGTGGYTGAIIGGYAFGNVNISGITFSGLSISHYSKLSYPYDDGGLMLGHIGVKSYFTSKDTIAKIEKINMRDYDENDRKNAAASLIAKAGLDKSYNIQISFKDMKLLDQEASSPFKYSSFIYKFEYSNNSKDNKSYGIYTFNYEDTVNQNLQRDDHNVTYGDEIKEGLNYNDYFVYDTYLNDKANPLKEAIEDAKKNMYIPYIHSDSPKSIYVNPKNGNITEGCGTYEDPYIIRDVAQFLTLYCYLSGEQDIYRFLFRPGNNDATAWTVVPIGGDGNGERCSIGGETHSRAIYGTSENFPSVDDMRTAYYRIENDIDLGSVNDVNYSTLLKQFSGLGSYKYPFSGVIIGNKTADICPTITLPTATKNAYKFSFIEYMQGAVVKDLVIKNTVDVEITNATDGVAAAGGVAAVILGGDNIVDNVICTLNLKVQDDIDGVGGYVGLIENGSLILRNIPEIAIKDSNIQSHDDQYCYTSTDISKTLFENNKVGLLVGSVKDGYVLYEKPNISNQETKKVLTNADLNVTGKKEVLSLINGFQLINGACLDAASGDSNSRIAITLSDKNFTVKISNEVQLEIMALALNSDSLSVYIDPSHADAEQRSEHLSGYDYTAKCRKALYNDVGTQNAKIGKSYDCIFARTYDDERGKNPNLSYPYLCYKYMEFSTGYTETENDTLKRYGNYKNTLYAEYVNDIPTKVVSRLNKADDLVKDCTTNYVLTAADNYLYDLSAYGNSFRGFGGLYSKEYSDFRANFDGQGHQVKITMDRDWTSDIYITGMFNSLIYDNKSPENPLVIQNLIITDSTFQNNMNDEYMGDYSPDDLQVGAARGAATGALAGEVQGKWMFKNISFQRTQALSVSTNQGVLLNALNNEDNRELICGVRGFMNVGGLIGRVNITESKDSNFNINDSISYEPDSDTHNNSNKIILEKCSVQGDTLENAVNIKGKSNAFAVGGLIGSVGANINMKDYLDYSREGCRFFFFGDVTFKDCSVSNAKVLAKDSGFLGGFAGTIGYRPGCYWRSVGSAQVISSTTDTSSGGEVLYKNIVENVNIRSYAKNDIYDNYSAGGIFGQVDVLATKPLIVDGNGSGPRNTEMETFTKENHEECQIFGVKVNNVTAFSYSTNSVDNNDISCNVKKDSNGIGGLIGYLNCRMMEIKNVSVQGSSIGVFEKDIAGVKNEFISYTDVGGLIGRSSSNGEACTAGSNHLNRAYYTNFLLIQDAEVIGSKIKNNQNGASAGGYIGYLSTDVVKIIGSSTASLVKNNTIISYYDGNAGGLIGKDLPSDRVPKYNYKTFYGNKWIENVKIINNDIRAIRVIANNDNVAFAGGLIGNFSNDSTYENRLTLGKIQIGTAEESLESDSVNNWIIGDNYAGGLCGFVNSYTSVTYKNYVKVGSESGGNTVIGRCSGGLYGKSTSKKELFNKDIINPIQIKNNSIIAWSFRDQITSSGGVAGVREYYFKNKDEGSKVSTYMVEDNLIITTSNTINKTKSNLYSGGLYGIVRGDNKITQYFDQLILRNNSIGYYSNTSLNSTKDWDELVSELKKLNLNKLSTGVLLFGPNDSVNNWRNLSINEKNVGDYSKRIGSYFGDITRNPNSEWQCVILRPTLEYSDNIGSIPAVDVGNTGNNGGISSLDYGYGYPYNYKSNCHIIYLDDYKSIEGTIIDISDSESKVKPVLDESVLMSYGGTPEEKETEYFFGNIETIVSEYSEVKKKADSTETNQSDTYAFLTSKRLNITMGGDQTENLICASKDNDDYFNKTYIAADSGKYNGVPVIEVDGQSAQYIGDYVAAILTNGGGVALDQNAVMDNILNISVVNAYIDPDGKIHAIGQDNKIEDTGQVHIQSSIAADNNQLSSEGCPFDEVIETQDGKKYYTISLLRYTYNSYMYDGTTSKKETIYIPVFVTKKVTLNSYLSILPGEEYSLKEALNNGYKDQVVITNDSVYTVYAEFVYDEVRKEEAFKNLKVEKTLKFGNLDIDGSYMPTEIQAGTKFTLVDVQSGEEYYYTAGNSITSIPFADFVKEDDTSKYSQRNIGDLTIIENPYQSIGYIGVADSERSNFAGEVGLERYFIVVEPSGEDSFNSFRLSIATEVVNESGQKKEELVRKFLDEGIYISQIYGPLIGFEGIKTQNNQLVGTNNITEIQGKISKDKSLVVDSRIRVSLIPENDPNSQRGGSRYWAFKAKGNTIDSSNAGKYLEIGVTLIDNDTKQEVNWPEGTNVIINHGTPIPLQGNSVIYAYKDNSKEFALDTISNNISNGGWYYYDISDVDGASVYQWITQDSNGEWYYKQVQNDGGSVTFPTKILKNFVFDENKVSVSNQCHLEFDFSGADIKDYAGKSYTVKMNLYRSSDPAFPLEEAGMEILDGSIREYSKTIQAVGQYDLAAAITPDDLMDLGINLYGNTKMIYEIPFTNQLDFSNLISNNEDKKSQDIVACASKNYMVTYRIYKKTKVDGSYKYVLVDLNKDTIPFTLYDVSTGATIQAKEITKADNTTEYVYQTSKQFLEQEIAAGTGQTSYVTSWKMKLSVDSRNLKDEDLANYKIEATYVPYTGSMPSNDEASTLKDYFIFTIAKLKTDF